MSMDCFLDGWIDVIDGWFAQTGPLACLSPFSILLKIIFISLMSYEKLHDIHNSATPMKIMKYRLELQLYKLYNSDNFNEGWLDLNFQQNFNGRNNNVQIMDCSRILIGKNNIVYKRILQPSIVYRLLSGKAQLTS